jgi:hypothetical protein
MSEPNDGLMDLDDLPAEVEAAARKSLPSEIQYTLAVLAFHRERIKTFCDGMTALELFSVVTAICGQLFAQGNQIDQYFFTQVFNGLAHMAENTRGIRKNGEPAENTIPQIMFPPNPPGADPLVSPKANFLPDLAKRLEKEMAGQIFDNAPVTGADFKPTIN